MTLNTIFLHFLLFIFQIIAGSYSEYVSYCSDHGHGRPQMTSISLLKEPYGVLLSHEPSNFTANRRIVCSWRLLFDHYISELDDLVPAPKSEVLLEQQTKLERQLNKPPRRFRMGTDGEDASSRSLRLDFKSFELPESLYDPNEINDARMLDDSVRRCDRNFLKVSYIDGHANKVLLGQFCGKVDIPAFYGEAGRSVILEVEVNDPLPQPFRIEFRTARPVDSLNKQCSPFFTACLGGDDDAPSSQRCIPETYQCDALSDCPTSFDEQGCKTERLLDEQQSENAMDIIPIERVVISSGCGDSPRYQTGPSGQFSSVNFPKKYSDNLRCVWYIMTQPNTKIYVTFNETFDIETGKTPGDCPFDSLNFYPRGSSSLQFGQRLCGKTTPKGLIIATSWLMVVFETDSSTGGKGFHLNWKSITAQQESEITGSLKLRTPAPTPAPYTEESCTTAAGVTIKDHAGFIYSPAYGSSPSYPGSIMCRWRLQPGAESQNDYNLTQINFRFLDFSVQSSKDCSKDFLLLRYTDRDNKLQWHRYCNGANVPPFEEALTLKTHTGIEIIFRADSWIEDRGFQLSFQAIFAKETRKEPISNYIPSGDDDALLKTCGLAPKAKAPAAPFFKGSSPFIIPGPSVAEPGTFNWLVHLNFRQVHRCAGTVVADRWIVAAANCFKGEFGHLKSWEVRLEQDGGTSLPVAAIYIHHQYGKTQGNNKDFDIALVKLASPLTFDGQNLSPICLPSRNVRSIDRCYTIGWHESKNGRRDRLKFVHSPIVPLETCHHRHIMYEHLVTRNMVCAGYEIGAHQICHASLDGASPLACFVNGKWELHGILSFGKGCAGSRAPDVYTRVDAMSDWIQRVIVKFS